MEESIDSFGYLLKRYRKALDLTQAELGRRVGCSAAAIRKIEAGERRPSAQLAALLVDQLNVPIDQRPRFLQIARHVSTETFPGPSPQPVLQSSPPSNPKNNTNLPASMIPLVGRTREIQAITHFLREESVRLLTLVGPPGIGKTRLSLQCGQEVQPEFQDGVWFVDLSTLQDASLVLYAILRVLPEAEEASTREVHSRVIQAIGGKNLLLILDNFEHLVDWGTSDLVEILSTCPEVKILVTSRLPLHLYGEYEYPVPALSVPPADAEYSMDELVQYEAIQLFLLRMRQHTPSFTLDQENAPHVVGICRRMEGIPLAIELAAATARHTALEEMAQTIRQESGPGWLRLFKSPARDLPPRQRTLYSTIAWSYNLLEPSERSLFRCLGVFSGSFDKEAVVAVCQGGELDPEDSLSTLEKLEDLYLLSWEQENLHKRWRLLELVREFALETLAESDELQDVQRRHAHYFAEQLASLNTIAAQREYMQFSQLNTPNLYAALDWAIQAQEAALAVSLVGSLAWMWERQGFQREGLSWAQKALALPGQVPPDILVNGLFGAGNLSWQLQQYDQALVWMQAAIELTRDNRLGLSYLLPLLNQSGRIYIQQKRYDLARQTLQECLDLARSSPESFNPGRPLDQLGEAALAEGSLEEATVFFSEALRLLEPDDYVFQAGTRIHYAQAALLLKDYPLAKKLLTQAFAFARMYNSLLLFYLSTLAGLLAETSVGDEENARQAVQLFGAAKNLCIRSGYEIPPWAETLKEPQLELTHQKLPQIEWERAWFHGFTWTKEEAESQVEALLGQIS